MALNLERHHHRQIFHPMGKGQIHKNQNRQQNILKIPGAPTINNTKLGYCQFSIQRNPETRNIKGKFLEIIPDPIYWQEKQKVESKDFTGRIMEFDLHYKLQKGMIYQKGKRVGESRPSTTQKDIT